MVTINIAIMYNHDSLASFQILILLKLDTANKHIPTGGERFPIIINNVITTPKLIKSIPNKFTIGKKIGIVMKKIALPSRNIPRIKMRKMIIVKTIGVLALRFVNVVMILSGID